MPKAGLGSQVPLLAAALFISFVIWLMAKTSSLETEQLLIPIFLDNPAENVKVEHSPKNINIVVRFPHSQRARIVEQNFEVRLNTIELFGDDPRRPWAGVEEPAVHSIKLTFDHVHALNLPQSIRVSEFSSQPRLKIEATLITQSAPVKIETLGALPVNYELREPLRAEPSRVLITGPPESLKRLTDAGAHLLTEPVRLEGHTEDFVDYLALRLPRGVDLVDPALEKIQVFVAVEEKEIVRTFEEIPFKIYIFDETLTQRFSPSSATIRVRGKISILERLEPRMFKFFPKAALVEELGIKKAVSLEVGFDEDAPAAIREQAQIEGFEPTQVDIEFSKKEAASPE